MRTSSPSEPTVRPMASGFCSTSSLSAASSTALPSSPPPYAPSLPRPVRYLSQLVVNTSNTYHTYAIFKNGTLIEGQGTIEGERLYIPRPDGTLVWAPLLQVHRVTLAADPNLRQMVTDTGGDPDSFDTPEAMADYMLRTEYPTHTLRPADELEMFGDGTTPVEGLGPPASDLFWGFGQWTNGVVTIAPSTQEVMQSFVEGDFDESSSEDDFIIGYEVSGDKTSINGYSGDDGFINGDSSN